MATGRSYTNKLTADINAKGVIDIDTVNGCRLGMEKYPGGGCYLSCYAAKIAKFRGIDFKASQRRMITNVGQLREIRRLISISPEPFVRIGTMGDPCHEWDYTISVCRLIAGCNRAIVIITKHWIPLTDENLKTLQALPVVFNTSVSALDTREEIEYRLAQHERLQKNGIKAVLRVVTCKFNKQTDEGMKRHQAQASILNRGEKYIDNPLRVTNNHPLVKNHVILVEKRRDLDTEVFMSINNPLAYTGNCRECGDKCGVTL